MRLPKRHRWLWAVGAGILVLALVAVAAVVIYENESPESAKAASATTADEQAASGPLVGDPTLISGEQSCEQDNPNPPWFPTIAAFEVYDSARTHLYGCAHFLGSTTSSNSVLAYKSTGSFVAGVEPGTLNQRWRRVLINTNATNEWGLPRRPERAERRQSGRHLRLPHRQAGPGDGQRRGVDRARASQLLGVPIAMLGDLPTGYVSKQ